MQDLGSLYEKADFVFEGNVISRTKLSDNPNGMCWEDGQDCGSKVATLSVGEVWKGDLKESVSVFSVDACYCLGTNFRVADKSLVFAVKSDDSRFELKDLGACATRPFEPALKRRLARMLSGVPEPEPVRIIVDATVVSSKAVEWNASASYRSCGFENELRVNEVFDGAAEMSMAIGSRLPLVPGARYLFHLENSGGFASIDMWPEDIQEKINECLDKLPLLKNGWPSPSRIVNVLEPLLIMNGPQQAILLGSAMTFEVKEIEFDAGPNKLTTDDVRCTLLGDACSKRTIYLWTEFREWLKALLRKKTTLQDKDKSLNTDASEAGAG